MKMVLTLLCASMFVLTPLAVAQEFPSTPKHETLQQAIQFEKHKIAAAEAQAKKDAGETSNASRAEQKKTVRAGKAARKSGQADSSAKRQ